MLRLFFTAFTFLLITCLTNAGTPVSECPFTTKAPAIDGTMNDACWKKAAVIDKFVKIGDGSAAAVKSRTYVCTDGKNLYIFAELADPEAAKLPKTKTARDKIDWSETFEVFIVPSPKREVYYHIAVTPSGSLYDCIGQSTASDQDFDIKYSTQITSKGWLAELSVPLKDLGLVNGLKAGDVIAFNLCRGSKSGASAWSATGSSFHSKSKFGSLVIGNYQTAGRKTLKEITDLLDKFKEPPYRIKTGLLGLRRQIQTLDSAVKYKQFMETAKVLEKAARASLYPPDRFVFWKCTPWSLPKSDKLPDLKKCRTSFNIIAMQNEVVTFALGVANPGLIPVRVRCVPSSMFNLTSGELIRTSGPIKLRHAVELKIRGDVIQRDALPPLNIENAIDIRSQNNAVIWLTIDTRSLSPGKWVFNLELNPLIERKFKSKVFFELAVAPAALPETSKPYSYNWARYNWPPTKNILQACYQDQIAHYSNVVQTDPLGVEVGLRTLKFDPNGKLLNDPDFTKLQEKIDVFGKNCMYIFGIRYSNLPKQFLSDKNWSAKQGKANFARYLKALYALVDKNKIPEENFVWYIEDEPSLERAKDAVKLAKLFQELAPKRFSTFVTFYRKTSLETIKTLLPYVTLWCPSFSALPAQLELIKKHGRKDVRFFGYAVNTRAHHPYWAYRLCGLRALKAGYIGMGFWNYCDAGDSPTSSTWDDFESRRNVSDFAVIYEGAEKPTTSVRWEAWRQGILDYKFIVWLKELSAKLPASLLKTQAEKLANDAVNKTLGNARTDTADVSLDKIRRMIVKILVKLKKLPESSRQCFSMPTVYNLTGNDNILKNLNCNGYYLVGSNPHKFMINKNDKLTDANLRFPEGYSQFSSGVVIFDLKKKYKLDWLLISASENALKNGAETATCYVSANKASWEKAILVNTRPGIRGTWATFRLPSQPCQFVKVIMLGKESKGVGEVKILGQVN